MWDVELSAKEIPNYSESKSGISPFSSVCYQHENSEVSFLLSTKFRPVFGLSTSFRQLWTWFELSVSNRVQTRRILWRRHATCIHLSHELRRKIAFCWQLFALDMSWSGMDARQHSSQLTNVIANAVKRYHVFDSTYTVQRALSTVRNYANWKWLNTLSLACRWEAGTLNLIGRLIVATERDMVARWRTLEEFRNSIRCRNWDWFPIFASLDDWFPSRWMSAYSLVDFTVTTSTRTAMRSANLIGN